MQKSKILRKIWYKLSSKQRFAIRKWYYFPIDSYDLLTKKRHPMVPPRGAIYTGSAANAVNFLKQGLYQLDLLKELTPLNPQSSVLDIGSGIGRTAIALTTYLKDGGSYDGFDVVKSGVDWCNKKIKSSSAPFTFIYTPIFNDLYNNTGVQANTFVFPYPSHSFDIVFSFSVFTHMQIDEIENYLKEIHRVLNNKGVCLSTFFTYTDETEMHISQNQTFSFPVLKDQYRLMNTNVKSGNIAIHQNLLRQLIDRSGLHIIELIDGNWKSPNNTTVGEYQDIVIFKRK